MLYRALKDLGKGKRIIYRNSTFFGDELSPEAVEGLLKKGKIAEVSAPPLSVLPGFTRRAVRLQKFGIEKVDQFLEASNEELADALSVKPTTVARWKNEARSWMEVPKPQNG